MNGKSKVRFPSVLIAMACTVALTSCAKKAEETGTATSTTTTSESGSGSSSSTASGTTTGTAASTTTSSGDKTSTEPTTDMQGKDPEERKAITEIDHLQKQIKIGSMPDSMTICTVAGTPITVGEYRHFLKQQAEQLQARLGIDQQLKDELLNAAKAQNVTLTAEEKKRLLDTASKAEKATNGVLNKLLKEDHENPQQFQKNLLDLGLAFKYGSQRIEAHLLQQIIDREMLCAAARAAGFGPKAYQTYVEKKEKHEFQQMTKDSHMSEAEVRDEFIKDELVRRMIAKVQKDAVLPDAKIKEWYDAHQKDLKHGDIIRLSQIVIAAPTSDIPPLESVRTQIKKQNPSLSKEDLDKQVAIAEKAQKQKAQDLLDRVKKGENFGKLADENTDDVESRAAKVGGDMGYKEKKDLLPQFADKVWALKPGEVLPGIVETPFGFHVIKVTGKQSPGTWPFDLIKPQLKEQLQINHSQQAVDDWFRSKRRTSNIVISKEFQEAAKIGNVSPPRKD